MDVFKLKRFTDEGIINDDIRAEQLISPLAIDNEKRIFLCGDHTLGFCFECQPLSGGSEKEKDKVDQLLSQNFPENTTISFLLFRSPDIEENVLAAERLRFHFNHPLLTPVFQERENFLKEFTQKDLISTSSAGARFNIGRVVDVKLIVSVKIPFSGEVPSEDTQAEVLEWATKLQSGLKNIGFAPIQMDADRYVRFMNVFINWDPKATWRQRVEGLWEDDKPIPAQIFDPESSVWMANPNHIQIGKKFVKVLSAKKMPESTYFGNAIQYIGDLSGNLGQQPSLRAFDEV